MSSRTTLSAGIAAILSGLEPVKDLPKDEYISLSGEDVSRLYRSLEIMRSLAIDLEIEVGCFRDMEDGREMRATAERNATENLSDLLVETGSKIIRPDFGGNKP